MDAQYAAEAPGLSRRVRELSRWVGQVGALRVTLLLTAFTSFASLVTTWGFLYLSGHPSMGNAWWISMLVPVPMTLVCGGITFYMLVALETARARVHEMAMQDPLTGLCNRRRFVIAARRELDLAARHHQPLAVLLLDVDHFKLINDEHGHQVGDRVLMEVSRRCELALRATDVLARWGGEEFIVLLPNTPVEQAQLLAERMRQAISATAQVQVRERSVRVTVSVGAAGAKSDEARSLDELVSLADAELYKAKTGGRDRVSISGVVAAALAGALPETTERSGLS